MSLPTTNTSICVALTRYYVYFGYTVDNRDVDCSNDGLRALDFNQNDLLSQWPNGVCHLYTAVSYIGTYVEGFIVERVKYSYSGNAEEWKIHSFRSHVYRDFFTFEMKSLLDHSGPP